MPNFVGYDDAQTLMTAIKNKIDSGGGGGEFPQKYVSWNKATNAEIAQMLSLHDNGSINIYDIWRVGERRKVHINAINPVTYGTVTYPAVEAQDVNAVIYNRGYYKYDIYNNDIHYLIGLEGLNVKVPLNDTDISTGGYSEMQLRNWLIYQLWNAIETGFKELLEPVAFESFDSYNGTPVLSYDKVFLFGMYETIPKPASSANNESALILEYFTFHGNTYFLFETYPQSADVASSAVYTRSLNDSNGKFATLRLATGQQTRTQIVSSTPTTLCHIIPLVAI